MLLVYSIKLPAHSSLKQILFNTIKHPEQHATIPGKISQM
jgi:hypothetical protein